MTTEPNETTNEQDAGMDGRGAEIGISDGEGSSFEPEEDAAGHTDEPEADDDERPRQEASDKNAD